MWFLLKYPVTGISQQLLVFRKSSIQLSCLRQINSVFRVAIQLNFQALSPESLSAISKELFNASISTTNPRISTC